MGCDATRELPEDNSMLEDPTTTPEGVPGTNSDALGFEENVSTVLVDEAPAGSNIVRVESEDQLTFGDSIRISGSGMSETRTILAFGSVVLCSPLEHSYPPGSSVTKTGSTYALGSDAGSVPQVKKGVWSSWFRADGELKVWEALLTAGLALVVLAIVPAACAAQYHRRGTRTPPKSRGTTSDRLCEGGADGESDEEIEEELESREPLMASFSEALKQGPFQSCATPSASPAPPPQTGGSAPGAPPCPVVATVTAATGNRYTCQLPPVHIAHVTSFSQQTKVSAHATRSYRPLRCQSPQREPGSPQPAPRSP